MLSSVAAVAAAATANADTFKRDTTPLSPAVSSGTAPAAVAHASTSGGTVVRLFFGLALVLALVWIVRLLLKRAARVRGVERLGNEVSVLSTVPLGGTRAVHLLRVGDELVLVGAAEHGITPLRVYDAAESRTLLATTEDGVMERLGAPAGGGLARTIDDLRRRTAR